MIPSSLHIASPWFSLLLLIPVIVLIFAIRLKSKLKSTIIFPFAKALKEIRPVNAKISSVAEKLPLLLRITALILIAAGLMRFQDMNPEPFTPNNISGTDIIICLDTSPSMLSLDFNPDDRLTVAKKVISTFIDGRMNDRIGLVAFSGAAMTLCPLTTDYPALQATIAGITEKVTQTDGTAIGDAIATSVNRLKNSSAKTKIIILVTDGRSNMGQLDPMSAADIAKKLGIKIYTIGVAKKGKTFMPIKDPITGRVITYREIGDDLDEETLEDIAKSTNGIYERATDKTTFENIFKQIDSLEKTSFKAKQEYTYTELFNYFLIPALAILLLEIFLSYTLCRKIP